MNVKPASTDSTPATNPATTPPRDTTAVPRTDAPFRDADAATLATMLRASRHDTLAAFARFEQALADQQLSIPYHPDLNPPLWELGHVGWFQAHWLGRNPDRTLGLQANPDAPRSQARSAGADALFNSSEVPHASRWQLRLPDALATRVELAQVLDETLALLDDPAVRAAEADTTAGDTALYLHRLCLAHEDMHHEAAVYMAQALGIALPDPRFQHRALPAPGAALQLPAAPCDLGSAGARGFAFDNECGRQHHLLQAFSVDCQVLRWRDYLPFVEAGGYADARWWPGRAAAWRAAPGHAAPRYLQRDGAQWKQWRHGRWQALVLDEPACHLSAHEADAWCAWAGRRLPTEAEWEHAARTQQGHFVWGDVWEWTASTFGPYDGFVAHPYRDYSAPWFGSRRVLRGASLATQRRLHDLRYRNFFTPERNDIFAGFRSCAA